MVDIAQIKKKFDNLLILRADICAIFDILKSKVEVLQKIYLDLVKSHAHKSYVFGIDSFHFQNQLIETEYLNLNNAFKSIDNRVYCEYYNLYQMIQNYARKEIKDDKLIKSVSFNHKFAAYKHLDKDSSYDIKTIKEIHLAIAACIVELESLHTAREAELRNDRHQSELGLNIDNLVYTEMFINHMMKAKIDMFYRYLEVFNEHHVKYFTRLLLKTKLHMGIVNEDIMIKQFNQTSTTDINKLQKYQPITPSPQHNFMREEDDSKIKSYIKYENLGVSKQNVLNGIMAAAGSDSNTDGSDEGEEVARYDVLDSKEEEGSDNVELVIEPKVLKPKEAVNVLPTLIETNEIPEESEVASNIGDQASSITVNDINKRVLVEGYDSVGTLVFYGDHNSKPGKRCGVILDDPVGRNNGTIGGHKYFDCEDKKGILVAPYKVKIIGKDENDSD